MTPDLTRREFLEGSTAGTMLALIPEYVGAQDGARLPAAGIGPGLSEVSLVVNGVPYRLAVDVRATLIDTLRETLGLTGTKKGCDRGECGACTVHVGGRRVLSCLALVAVADGQEITTIEGLAQGGELHPVQVAFIEHDAFQCGFCTSGQIMSAVACIRDGHADSDDEIREFMSGNICRCAAYPQIVAAVRSCSGMEGI